MKKLTKIYKDLQRLTHHLYDGIKFENPFDPVYQAPRIVGTKLRGREAFPSLSRQHSFPTHSPRSADYSDKTDHYFEMLSSSSFLPTVQIAKFILNAKLSNKKY